MQEAHNMLPKLNDAFLRICQMHTQVQDIIKSLSMTTKQTTMSDITLDYLSSLKVLLSAIQSEINQLTKSGCKVKSLEDRLVNWHHLHNGKEILLSWKYGEKNINYWHETKPKSNKRKPLNLLYKEKSTT